MNEEGNTNLNATLRKSDLDITLLSFASTITEITFTVYSLLEVSQLYTEENTVVSIEPADSAAVLEKIFLIQ